MEVPETSGRPLRGRAVSAAWDGPASQFADPASGGRISLGKEPVKGFYGGELVVSNVEDGVELCDLEQIMDLLSEVEQL